MATRDSLEVSQATKPTSIRAAGSWAQTGRWHFVIAGIVIGIFAGAGLMFYLVQSSAQVHDPFTEKLVSQMAYALYYPTKLPAGYFVEASSLQRPAAGVVLFEAESQSGPSIYISEEARPQTYNFGSFYSQIAGIDKITTPNYTIAAGSLDNDTEEVGSWASYSTWIIAKTETTVPTASILTILKSLTPAR